MLRVGVIGVGIMGSGHVRTVHRWLPGAEVAAICDPDRERAGALAAEVGAVVLGEAELIDAVDAVVIAAPDAAHVALTLQCIAAGKPVLVEKPLALTPGDARTVVEAERASGRSLVSVGLMRRFDPAHVAVKDAIGPHGIGRPVLMRGIHRNQWRPDAPSGRGVIVASGIHDIDSARWLVGDFASVSAHGVDSLGDGAVDVVHIGGVHVSGAMSSLEVNQAAAYGYEVAAEVVGTAGTASSVDPDRAVLRSANRRAATLPTNWMPRFDDAYRIELRAWVDSCLTGAPFAGASAADAFLAQVVAECAVQSLETGAAVAVPAAASLLEDPCTSR